MKNLLLNPNLFFNEKLKNEISFKYPIMIMLINSIIGLGSSLIVMTKVIEPFPSELQSLKLIMIFGGAFGALVATIIYWVILTGIFYLISSVFNSVGSFKRTLEFVAYGFVPQIFSSIVGFLVLYTLLPSINISSQNSKLFADSLTQVLMSNPLSLASQIFGIICFLFSTYIWIFALLHARNMSIKNAIITVCIPVALYLIYQIYLVIGRLL